MFNYLLIIKFKSLFKFFVFSAQRGSNDCETNKKYLKNIIAEDNDPSESKQSFQTVFPTNLASIVAQKSSGSEMSLQDSKDIKTNDETIQDHGKNHKKCDQVLVLQKVHCFYNVNTKNLKPKIKLIIPKMFESKSRELIDIFKKTERIDASTSDEHENETSKVACLDNYSDDSDNDGKERTQYTCPSCSKKMEIDISKLNKNIFDINDELNHSSWSLSTGDFLSVPTAINTDGKAINSSLFPSNENFIDTKTYFNFKESIYKNNFKLQNTTADMHNIPNSYNKANLEHKLTNDFITILKPQKRTTDNIENFMENESHTEMPHSDLHTNAGVENGKKAQNILNKDNDPLHTRKNDENGNKFKESEKLSHLGENENCSTLESVIYHLQKISNITNEFSQTDNDQVIKFLIYCALRYYILKETPNSNDNSLSNGVENHDKNKYGNKNESEKLNVCQENMTEVNNLLHYRNRLKHFMNVIHDNANSLAANEDELELDSNILGKLLMYYYISNSDSGNFPNQVSDVLSLSNSSSQHESEDEYNLYLSPREKKLKNIFKHLTNHSIGIQSIGINSKNKGTQYSNSDLYKHVKNGKISQSFSFANQCPEKREKIDRKCYTYVMDMNKFEQIRRIRNKEVKHRVFRHFSTNSLVLGRNTDQTNKLYKSLMLKLGGAERKREISREKHCFKNINQQRHTSKNTKNFHSHAHNDIKCLFRGGKHTAKIDKHNVEDTKRQKELKSTTKKHTVKRDCPRHNPVKEIKINKFHVSPMIHNDKQAGSSDMLKAPLRQCVTNKNTDSNYSLFHHIKQILNWSPKEI